MTALQTIVLVICGWSAACLAARFLLAPPLARICGDDPFLGLLMLVVGVYCKVLHGLRIRGLEHVPPGIQPGSLIVVANHTAGIDPLVVQTACRFHIRWMMSSEMMIPALDWFWKRRRVIPVNFDASDAAAVKEAIRHVRAGGVLGIFPEGGIERPARVLRPFMPGAGLIVARCKAPVMLVWIHGSPDVDTAYASFTHPSQTRVEVLGIIRYDDGADARTIVSDLQSRLAAASHWPISDEPLQRG